MSDEMIERARRIVTDRPLFMPTSRPWAEALLAEREARVAAERERDEARARLASEFHEESAYGSRSELARQVATLKAALREFGWHDSDCDQYDPTTQFTDPDRGRCTCGFAAALGEQDTPTEPTGYNMTPPAGTIIHRPQVAPEPTCPSCRGVEMDPPCEDTFHEQDEMVSAMWNRLAAPQVAPEPERLGRTDWFPPSAHPIHAEAPQALAAPPVEGEA